MIAGESELATAPTGRPIGPHYEHQRKDMPSDHANAGQGQLHDHEHYLAHGPPADPYAHHHHHPAAAPPAAATTGAKDAEYTCPMHPQIRQIGPGHCPICGMALEPVLVTVDAGDSPELRDMTRRFWIG